ncbi:copper chaperone PCu(A)C [Rothia aeria]|uniref:copper chaperone PCu(A)C n=1 Tax=Rothia aeria TaxID=172042 RepID=UPI001C560A0D|nr:copper chaperone PCu(A)C [Rothia aeria]QXW92004.1 copper chaperone PCu(A)C [Rothia aeria]
MFKNHQKLVTFTCTAAAGVLLLSACGGGSTSTGSSGSASASSSASSSASAGASAAGGQGASASSGTLKIEGAWVKASKGGMTGVFGKITNSGDKPVKITGASSTATDTVQLHTTTKGSDGGTKMEQVHEFTIEPGATLELKPGGDHIMLMDMSCSLAAGGATTVTVKTEDGASLEFKPVARDYQGAKEEYKGEGSASATADASASGHDHSHSHGGHDHSHSHGGHDHSHSHGGHDHSHEGHDHEHGGSSASGSASAGEHADHDHGEGSHEHSHGAAGASESPLPECK